MKYPVKFCEMYKKERRRRKKRTNRYVVVEMYVKNVFECKCACVCCVCVCIKLKLWQHWCDKDSNLQELFVVLTFGFFCISSFEWARRVDGSSQIGDTAKLFEWRKCIYIIWTNIVGTLMLVHHQAVVCLPRKIHEM